MSSHFTTVNDFVDCIRCMHVGYIPIYVERRDGYGYYDKVWRKCGWCHGTGYYKPIHTEGEVNDEHDSGERDG